LRPRCSRRSSPGALSPALSPAEQIKLRMLIGTHTFVVHGRELPYGSAYLAATPIS
jgi:hypothetical protein